MSEETQDVVYETGNDQTNESEDNYSISLLVTSPSASVDRPQPGHSGGAAN